jgi:hypothetical protein
MRTAIEAGAHSLPWTTHSSASDKTEEKKGAHVARAPMELFIN